MAITKQSLCAKQKGNKNKKFASIYNTLLNFKNCETSIIKGGVEINFENKVFF